MRWRDGERNRARRFWTFEAASRFDRHVKDLKAAGELHLLDAQPRGMITLVDYAHEVWWPDYAELNLTDEGRANYSVQLDLRIIPRWGDTPLRDLQPGPIEAWVTQLRKQGVGDPTILKTLTVFRSILKRAERDGEIERNPIPLVAKPKQQVKRAPRPIAPYLVERIRALLLDPPERRDRRGRRLPTRAGARCEHRDATLVSLLAYAGPRPESEALPMTFGQIGRRTLTFRATKGGTVVERETRLLEPLARDLRDWRRQCPRSGDDDLVFPVVSGGGGRARTGTTGASGSSSRPRWRSGSPDDTIPRDLRGSFASLLIFEGLNVARGGAGARPLAGDVPALLRARVQGVRPGPPAPGGGRHPRGARSRSPPESYPLSTRTRPMLPPERHRADVESGAVQAVRVKPSAGLEPATPSLPWKCSTS